MTLLALDIDGVLHPAGAPDHALLTRLPLLEAWLRRRPNVQIVITSSWRVSHSLEGLRELFSSDLQCRVIGKTGVYWKRVFEETGEVPLTTRHERDRELRHWLEENRMIGRPWAALEDEAGNYAPTRRNIVVCDPKIGLTEREIDVLERLVDGLENSAILI